MSADNKDQFDGPFDIEILRKAAANDPERLSSLLKALVTSVEESLVDISQSLVSEDRVLLGQSVHRLKGTLAMSGATQMADCCATCLQRIEKSEDWSEVAQLTQDLNETLRKSIAHLS